MFFRLCTFQIYHSSLQCRLHQNPGTIAGRSDKLLIVATTLMVLNLPLQRAVARLMLPQGQVNLEKGLDISWLWLCRFPTELGINDLNKKSVSFIFSPLMTDRCVSQVTGEKFYQIIEFINMVHVNDSAGMMPTWHKRIFHCEIIYSQSRWNLLTVLIDTFKLSCHLFVTTLHRYLQTNT